MCQFPHIFSNLLWNIWSSFALTKVVLAITLSPSGHQKRNAGTSKVVRLQSGTIPMLKDKACEKIEAIEWGQLHFLGTKSVLVAGSIAIPQEKHTAVAN